VSEPTQTSTPIPTPSSNIPDAVRKQIADADAAYKAVYGSPAGEATPPAPGEVAPAGEPPVTEGAQAPVAAADQTFGAPSEEQTADMSQSSQEVGKDEKGEKKVDWEHKFKTLQGMFESKQQKAQKVERELRDQINALNLLVTQLRSQPPAPRAPSQRLVTDEEAADYGPDMIDVIKRAAREELLPELETVREQVTDVNKHLIGTAEERMYAALDANVPNWRVLNTDPGFLNWLQEIDPFSGQQRHSMLNSAVTNLDTFRVQAFFKGYIDQTAAVDDQAPQPEAGQARQPQVSLESLVAPGRPKSTTGQGAQQSNGKRVWNSGDIQRFYEDVRKGAYRSRVAERERIEQEIIAAGREGRVR
jgi:hypothetical protein